MKFITRKDVEDWAERLDSKGNFPWLIGKLVDATTPISTTSDFPTGTATFVGGYDGKVNCAEGTKYVPKGVSLWEFGTEQSNNTKAQSDYDKRTKDPLGYDISECTFVFATPTFWRDKDTWKQDRLKEGKWKDIKVYDSSDLEQWLESAPAVARWFAAYTGSYPYDGILTADDFWQEWSVGPLGILSPVSVTAGREFEIQELLSFLSNPPGIKAIRASSKNEATAFIIAAAKQFIGKASQSFFSRTLIVETPGNFRALVINKTGLILIAKVDETGILYRGVTEGHHVLVPLGADDEFNQDIIVLPKIANDGLHKSLVEMGISEENAIQYIKESGCNITILKKILKFSHDKIKWTQAEHSRDIIPSLLLGRWDETKSADAELLSEISGKSYEEYIEQLSKWLHYEAPPAQQIGNTWRLTSPLEAWADLSPCLLKSDLNKLATAFSKVFIETDDSFDIPAYPHFSTVTTKYSRWLREGLLQSLILVAYHGDKLKIPTVKDTQTWVNILIDRLLDNANPSKWRSLSHELPLIAEAAPDIFLSAVEKSINTKDGIMNGLFDSAADPLNPNDKHAGLLWALEGLSWLPEYLRSSSKILSKLSSLDLNIKIVNSPLNSLVEIFKTWHYQTLANYDQRIDVLSSIVNSFPDVGWNLLVSLLPNDRGIAHPTYKFRWRMFEVNTTLTYTYEEIYKTHSFAIDQLLRLFDNSSSRFSQLIHLSENLLATDKQLVLKFLKDHVEGLDDPEDIALNTLRKLLSRHRSYPDTDWAMPESLLTTYDELYQLLMPTNEIESILWLFNDPWPQFKEGFLYEDPKEISETLTNKRKDALRDIYAKHGIEILWRIVDIVKEPGILGDTAAFLVNAEEEEFLLCSRIGESSSIDSFLSGFVFKKAILNGLDWIFKMFEKLKVRIDNSATLAKIFIPLRQSEKLLEFIGHLDIDIQNEFWKTIQPFYTDLSISYKILELNKFIDFRRFSTAIQFALQFIEDIPSDLLVNLLLKAATEVPSEPVRIQSYQISMIFKEIQKRENLDKTELLKLEWLYIESFDHYSSHATPLYLYKELSENPLFFVEMLQMIYKSSDPDIQDDSNDDLTDEQIAIRARKAYDLLSHWTKIPGVDVNNRIDKTKLWNWINSVRESAKKIGRLRSADMKIGQVIAQYPELSNIWPPFELSEVIETIGTDSIVNNFQTAVFNKRGATSRSLYEGGAQERVLAKKLRGYASKQIDHYPKVANALLNLAKGYENDAQREDDEAERDRLEYGG